MQILSQAIPKVLQEAGIPELVKHNQSRSRRGVLHGLHYQLVSIGRPSSYPDALCIPTMARECNSVTLRAPE